MMESLKYDDVEKKYSEVLESLQERYPGSNFEGKNFEVTKDIETEVVILKIGDDQFYMTRRQALDLSYALSKEAKRIVKKRRMMGI